jgi:hypothetical protein
VGSVFQPRKQYLVFNTNAFITSQAANLEKKKKEKKEKKRKEEMPI